MPFIDIISLTKKYHQLLIIKDFSYKFRVGKIHLLIGENGSGKTTIIKMITGLIFPTKGKIIVDGEISFVPDKLYFPEEMSVLSFLKTFTLNDTFIINQYILKYNLQEYKNQKLRKLSKGTKHKVLLLAGLIRKKDIYIFDEPLNGLDQKSKETFIQDIIKLQGENKLVIIATHQKELFDREIISEINL